MSFCSMLLCVNDRLPMLSDEKGKARKNYEVLRAECLVCNIFDVNKSPNPFPMGNKFGFLKYGGDYRTRTCDLLRVKQAL